MGSTIRKEMAIGIIASCLVSIIGVLFFFWALLDGSLSTNLAYAYRFNELGRVIVIGSIPNLALFFLFLRINRFYRARGVLMFTIVLALGVVFLNLTSG